jgi:DNA-binding response OmpR family regulator
MKTILVVDDEFDLTGTLRAILESEGYRADTCSNGKEALEHLRNATPDLVFMDVMMPVLSGFEVLQEMRRTDELERVPVVLMSAVAPGVKQSDFGWQAFLRKPFSLQTLVAMVEGLIGKAGAVAKS